MSNRSVRLIDLARAADVSIATASQVMNGSGRVAEATRARVLETARRLDYRPNALARSVASGRSNTIGIVAENASGAFCMPVLVGANRALSVADLASTLYDAEHDSKRRREHIRRLQARHVDGVVVIGEGTDSRSASMSHEFAGPVIYALSRSDDQADTNVVPDDAQAGVLAAEHFVEIGRTRVLHVTAEANLTSVHDRQRGLTDALASRGLALAGPVLHGNFTREWGFTAGKLVAEQRHEVDAIFAGNDEIAIGLHAQLLSAGIRVPEDIAIIGVDNAAGQAGSTENFLTSIDPQFDSVGSSAVEIIVARLSGADDGAIPRAVPGMLVKGRSTIGGAATARSLVIESLLH